MPPREGAWVSIQNLRGGLNDSDPPEDLSPTQVTAATNIDWHHASVARKRGGSTNVGMTGYTDASELIATLIRHTPTANQSDAELWAYDPGNNTNFWRLDNSTTWASVAVKGTLNTSNAAAIFGASLNGKLFLAYDHATTRLAVYDGTSIRWAGLGTTAAATVANTGAGSYAATLRYYKVAFCEIVGIDTVRQSDLSASVSFTPSGTGTAARVTKPAALSEGETHWKLFGSADGANYFLLATTAVATTTYDDSVVPANYVTTGAAAPLPGEYTAPPDCKYLLVDEDRLLMAGSWETAANGSRVWFTPVAGDTDIGDDERIPVTTQRKYYINIDRRDGGDIMGLGGPLYSAPYVFKYSQIHKLVRTGNSRSPYQVVTVSKSVGALGQRSIVLGEMMTAEGSFEDALYFLDKTGPYRLRRGGIDYLGGRVETFWDTVSLSPSYPHHGVYHSEKKQVWWWVTTSLSVPSRILVYHVRLDAWSIYDSVAGSGGCSVMFARTIGATMSSDLTPHTTYVSVSPTPKLPLVRACDTTSTDDSGTAFAASLTTKPYRHAGVGTAHGIRSVAVTATAVAGSGLTVSLERDFGAETREGIVDLSPTGVETRVTRTVQGLEMTDAQVSSLTIGDTSISAETWQIDRIDLFVTPEQTA